MKIIGIQINCSKRFIDNSKFPMIVTIYAGFWSITYKSLGIGECMSVLGNYSISELK